ncbi:divergent CRAL/TRIO domain-containing protein [Cryomyces antarcticus]
MRSVIANRAQRLRSSSLIAVPPPQTSSDYQTPLARYAASILYRSPLPCPSGFPLYILNAAALPDAHEIDYDALLPYVLARLPGEEELLSGTEYTVVFFAGGSPDSATSTKKIQPGWGWFVQAYHVLSRATRKRLQKLYIVHERSWVRILVKMFSTIVSPKFRKKIVHASTLTGLALHLPIEDLLVPPSAYLHDRQLSPNIHAPYVSGRRAFCAKQPFPRDIGGNRRLPRVLRETSSFLLLASNPHTEGLFRIPPHAKTLDVLREAYDRGQKFIVWKEGQIALPLLDIESSGHDEMDQRDAYGVYLAAGLIKMWYRELREPVFPQSCYKDLKAEFGSPLDVLGQGRLAALISPDTTWSLLPATSRLILCLHLVPFLSAIALYQEHNKMTPENLAICFAPALVCGPDQLEDAKISSIIRRVLQAATEEWAHGLRELCTIDEGALSKDLQPPLKMQDYEDPLYDDEGPEASTKPGYVEDSEKQSAGIILQDNETMTQEKPPLPPRPSASRTVTPTEDPSDELATRRKPAPPLVIPPRYSLIMTYDNGTTTAESPVSYAAATNGFSPPRASNWSPSEQDEKKSPAPTSADPSPIVVPKRKPLTIEQINSIEEQNVVNQSVIHENVVQRSRSDSNAKAKALATTSPADVVRRKPLQSSRAVKPTSPQSLDGHGDWHKTVEQVGSSSEEAHGNQTRYSDRSLWPASARYTSSPIRLSPTLTFPDSGANQTTSETPFTQ